MKVNATHIFRLRLQQYPKLIHSCGSLVPTNKTEHYKHEYFVQKELVEVPVSVMLLPYFSFVLRDYAAAAN